MREKDRSIVQDIKRRLPEEMQRHIERFIVFGSRARGDAPADSDLDLIALVDKKTPEIEKALDDVAYEVMWDHDFDPIISLKVFSRSKFEDSVARGLSFYKNVDSHGITV
jgi:predicted nucleotidyltransferase